MKKALVLVAHGTVESLEDLPAFLRNIRRGHEPPPDLVAEVRRRYEAIGGRSPLLEVSRRLAAKVEGALGVPVRVAMRLWRPYPAEVLGALAGGAGEPLGVAVVPLAQYSASIYVEAVREAAAALPGGTPARVAGASNWGSRPEIVAAFASRVEDALARAGGPAKVLFTAHSLPVAVIRGGDPYEREVQAAAEAIAARLAPTPPWSVCYQSQGMGTGPGGRPIEWLGPDLRAALEEARREGHARVVLAPIGFLADHVEILYDLDIEAMGWARELGITLSRIESLNDSEGLVAAVCAVARPLLAELG